MLKSTRFIFLLVLSTLFLFPFFWMLVSSFKPNEEVLLGLSFRSLINHNAKGKFTTSPMGEDAKAYADASDSSGRDASLRVTSPNVTSLGVAYSGLWDMTLYANTTFTQWDLVKKLVIVVDGQALSTTDLKYKNSFYHALGLEYKLNSEMLLRTGLAFEQGVAEDAHRTPRTPDSDRTIISGGFGYHFGSYKFDLGYTHYRFEDAKLALKDTGTGNNAGRGNLDADIKVSANVVMLSFAADI